MSCRVVALAMMCVAGERHYRLQSARRSASDAASTPPLAQPFIHTERFADGSATRREISLHGVRMTHYDTAGAIIAESIVEPPPWIKALLS